jgi:hypothetical protein
MSPKSQGITGPNVVIPVTTESNQGEPLHDSSEMSWDRTVEKFHWLSEPFADEDLRGRFIEAVQQLDARRTSDLMDLLAQVRPTAVFPATHPGIQ